MSEDLIKQIAQLEVEIDYLQRDIDYLKSKYKSLPRSNILSKDFLKRAFALYGHLLVAQFIIGVAIAFFMLLVNY